MGKEILSFVIGFLTSSFFFNSFGTTPTGGNTLAMSVILLSFYTASIIVRTWNSDV